MPEIRQRLEQLRRHIFPRPPAPETVAGQGGNPPSTPPESSVGPPSGPPSEPPRPPSRHLHSPSPPRNPVCTITTQDLVRQVAEGVERARQDRLARPEQGNIARLKMKNPETFDGKSSTAFNQSWEAVTAGPTGLWVAGQGRGQRAAAAEDRIGQDRNGA